MRHMGACRTRVPVDSAVMSPSTLQDQQTSEGDNPLLDIVLVVFIHG